ncbi:MAG TPA: histone deacetylase [Candidatus Methanoperedens sp.]|nr:histone deacetylase [Candidatus Methanoperedens sp.]
MTPTGFLYDPAFLEHRTPAGHPESPRRLERIVEHLESTGLRARLTGLSVSAADRESLLAVHHEAYLDRVERMEEGWIDPDTYRSAGSWTAALLAAGAVCRALDACRDGRVARAFCAVRPPGHHAEPARGMGFCLVNSAAVGARYAQRLGYARVMVADFDVHHGNGTQAAFYGDETVFYFSTHEYPHYPGTGAASERGAGRGAGCTRNVPLPAGAGDAALRAAWGETFRADVGAFRPDCCIVSAGYDLHEGDPLADLAVSDAGVRGIVRDILDACAGLPLVFTLEGGYNLGTLARCVGITVEELLR